MPLYRKAPAGLQNVIGSVYGGYLNYWRYGPATEDLVAEALERETWSQDRWFTWRRDRLAHLLRHAATEVPYYREQWRARRRNGDDSPVEAIENWPVLKKETLRANPRAFIAESSDHRSLFRLDTSGTSGTPVTTWRSRQTMQAWYALVEARWRRWYGVTRHDPWAIMGGQEVTPVERHKPPFWLWNRAGNQLYISTLHLRAENVANYLDALRHYGIVHIYGYPSSLVELARMSLEQGLEPPQLSVAVTNAEPLAPHQRDVIAAAFGCPVHTSYGMSEAVAGASECRHRRLHLWPEAGYVEVFADDRDVLLPDGQSGRLVCTGLLNFDMPLIRYDLGDRGAFDPGVLADGTLPCECGRAMPTIARLEGRNNDSLTTRDGRKVFWVNPVLYGQPLHEAQIIQESLERVVVKVVPAEGFGEAAAAHIAAGLRQRLGDVVVEVKMVDAIARGPNGKFRSVINRVDAPPSWMSTAADGAQS